MNSSASAAGKQAKTRCGLDRVRLELDASCCNRSFSPSPSEERVGSGGFRKNGLLSPALSSGAGGEGEDRLQSGGVGPERRPSRSCHAKYTGLNRRKSLLIARLGKRVFRG